MERALVGISASPGIVIGPVHLLVWEVPDVVHRIIADEEIESEIARFHEAVEQAKERLREVRDRAERHAGPEEAAIFEVQISILEDSELAQQRRLLRPAEPRRREGVRPGAARVAPALRPQRRAHDARARRRPDRRAHPRPLAPARTSRTTTRWTCARAPNAILVTHDLTPSLTVQLDRSAIAGIATDSGTRTSHVAILARSLGIPAVVGLRDATSRLSGSEYVVLDGSSGMLIVNPSPGEIDAFRNRAAIEAQTEAELLKLADAEPVTTDGVRITLRANVDLPEEAEHAAALSGAEGVGLMRTEFLVVGTRRHARRGGAVPRVRHVVEAFGGRPVVIRTYDIGGDKLPRRRLSPRAQPLPRLARHPDVPRRAGDLPHPAARPAPRRRPRRRAHHAPAHRHPRRGARRPPAARRGRRRARSPRGRLPPRPPARRHDRDARRRHRRRQPGGRRGLLQHRHQRPGAVHARRRSRERQPRQPLHPPPPGGPPTGQADARGGIARTGSTSGSAGRWLRSP